MTFNPRPGKKKTDPAQLDKGAENDEWRAYLAKNGKALGSGGAISSQKNTHKFRPRTVVKTN